MTRHLNMLFLHSLAVVLPAGLFASLGFWCDQPRAHADTSRSAAASDDSPLPDNATMEQLARKDPEAFLKNCLRRYQREVRGYHLIMQKQEREDGDLKPAEVIEAWYREKPHSVYLRWLEGAGRADRVLYVEGKNDDKLLAHPRSRLARAFAGDVVERSMDGRDGQQLSRFGLKRNVERTLAIWKEAREKSPVTVTYLGVQKVKEADDRPCYALRFTSDRAMHRGATRITIYVDRETWLMVGLVFKADDDKLMAEYFFRDVEINPRFAPDRFTRDALTS